MGQKLQQMVKTVIKQKLAEIFPDMFVNILGCSGVFILVSLLNFKISLDNLISTLLSSFG